MIARLRYALLELVRGYALRLAFRSGYAESASPRLAKAFWLAAKGLGKVWALLVGR